MEYVIDTFVLLGILCFAGLWFFEIRAFNRTGSVKFNFLTYLPFELNRFKRDQKYSYIYPAVQVAGSVFFAVPLYLFALMVQNNGGSAIACFIFAAVMSLALIAYNIVSFIKLSAFKLHMIFSTIFVALTLTLNGLYMFFFTSENYVYTKGSLPQSMQIVMFIILMVIIIFEFFLMINPTYKRWARMVKVDAETYNRPKKCYLAILEWGTLLNLLLSYIPIFLIMYF